MQFIPPDISTLHNEQAARGHYYLLPASGQLVCSPLLIQVINRGSMPVYEDFLEIIHPEDRESIRFYISGCEVFQTFSQSVRSNDATLDLVINGTVTKDPMDNRVIVGEVVFDSLPLPSENIRAIFNSVTNNAAAGLWLSDQKGDLIYLNKKMRDWTIENPAYSASKNWFGTLSETERYQSPGKINEAIASRSPFDNIIRMKRNDGSLAWYKTAGDPYYDEGGNFSGFAGYCLDITAQIEAERDLKISEARFRAVIEQAPVATCLFVGRELLIDIANEGMIAMWGKTASVLGLPLHQAVPELIGQPFLGILEHVYDSGEPYSARGELAKIEVGGLLKDFYFDYTYKPVYNADGEIYGIMDMAVDVTEQVMTTEQLQESEARFRSLILEAPFPTSVYRGRELIIEMANPEMIAVWGKGSHVIGMPLHLALPELQTQPFLRILDEVYTTGNTYNTQESRVDLEVGGSLKTFYFNFTYKPLFDPSGNVYAIFNMAVDVTSQVTARHQLEFAEYNLRMAIELAELGTWDIDLNTNEMFLSPRLAGWLGVPAMNPSLLKGLIMQ